MNAAVQVQLDAVLARLGTRSRVARPVTAEEGLLYMGAPWDAVLIERAELRPDTALGPVLSAWTMHMPAGGLLALHGWCPYETPSVPPVFAWAGPDQRVWTPIFCEGALLVWQCLGFMGDQA